MACTGVTGSYVGVTPGSSVRAASAFNCRAISPVSTLFLWAQLSVEQGFTILTNNQMKSAHEQGNAVRTDWESK